MDSTNAIINLYPIYTGAIQLKGIFPIDIFIPVGVESLNCTGREQNWTYCSYILRSPSGSCGTTASISCQGKSLVYDCIACLQKIIYSCFDIIFGQLHFVAPTTLRSNCTNGDVRLSGGSLNSEGYVQVCINNAWGSVCGSNWDSQDGNVVCRQLGLLPRGNASF